jgi:hypothetical protein
MRASVALVVASVAPVEAEAHSSTVVSSSTAS